MCYWFISAYANLPNSSCHFWKHKSVFLQILHQSSMPSNITPLYFFSSKIIYFGQRSKLRSKFFRLSSAQVKICQIPMSILKWQVNSSSSFASFFIVMTHNSSVNFKLMHFLLWTKGPHQSPNFDTFECSDENVPNSSCHFSNHKSVFFKFCITLQCHERKFLCHFLARTLYTLFRRSPFKEQLLETFECWGQNLSNSSCQF